MNDSRWGANVAVYRGFCIQWPVQSASLESGPNHLTGHHESDMAQQYILQMEGVTRMHDERVVLGDIWLSFFPGAKIGVLGGNGAGKSTLLRIMAGVDKDFLGDARPLPGTRIGHLPQEPQLDPSKDVRGNVMDGVREQQALLDQ